MSAPEDAASSQFISETTSRAPGGQATMTADQSPPAFSEMGEEIAKGWESLQEDMQRLIMDSNPTSEPGSPMGGATHDHHEAIRPFTSKIYKCCQ